VNGNWKSIELETSSKYNYKVVKQYIPSKWKQIAKSECYSKLYWFEKNKHRL